MDRNTLQTYGMVVVTLIIISLLLVVFTPLGHEVTNAIEQSVTEFINRTEIDGKPTDRDTVNRNPNNITKTITLKFIYNNGQTAAPTKTTTVPYGEKFKFNSLMPTGMDGYEPDFIPSEQTITKDINYTITYYPKQYPIIYDTQGGTIVSSKPNTYIYGQVTTLPTTVVKEGKFFAGWYANKKGTGARIESIQSRQTGEVKLFARWEVSSFDIKYMSDGVDITNTLPHAVKHIVYGSKQVDLPILGTKMNDKGIPVYFAGWYTNELLEGAPVNYTPKYPEKNLIYYAKWATKGFNLSFVTNGGEFLGSYPSHYTTSYGLKLPTNIVRNGCEFDGWYDNPNFKGERINHIGVSESGDKTYYAKWNPKKFTIDYNTNDGTVTGAMPRYYYYFNTAETPSIKGEIITFPTNVKKAGCQFVGWKDEATNEMVTGTKEGMARNLYLTAVFSDSKYRVTFDANGGYFGNPKDHIETDFKDVICNHQYGKLPTEPKQNGFEFIGWYTDKENGNRITENTILSQAKDITVYAHWASKSYRIIYETNGGTFAKIPVEEFEFGKGARLSLGVLKPHYNFEGWYTEPECKTPIVEITSNTNHDVHVYAKWSPKTYMITYDTTGGFLSGSFKTSYKYGEKVKLPEPNKWGFEFKGWYDKNSKDIIFNLEPGTYGNKELTAMWNSEKTHVKINLMDKDGQPLVIDTKPMSITLNDVEFGKEYTLTQNYAVNKLDIADTYYHDSIKFFLDNSTPKIDGEYQMDVTVYPYRKFKVISLNLKTDETLPIYDNVFKFKQSKDNVAEKDKDNPNVYENIAMKDIKISGDNKQFVFANKVSINGKSFACTTASSSINKILEKNLPYSDEESIVIYYYDSNAFEIKFDDDLNGSIVPSVVKPEGFPTTYYSTDGLTLPNPIRQCYGFTGWIALNSEGKAITLENGNTIPKGSKGTIILKSKWERKGENDECHDFKIIVPTDCTHDGYKVCKHCGLEVREKAFGHDWSNPVYQPYTGSVSGYEDGVLKVNCSGYDYHRMNCKRCHNAWLVEKHQKTDWRNNSNVDHIRECPICGLKEYEEHDFVYKFVDGDTHDVVCANKTCGYRANEKHDFIYYYNSEKGHLAECRKCGQFTGIYNRERPHTFAEYKGKWYCSLCDKAHEHPFIKNSDGTFSPAS